MGQFFTDLYWIGLLTIPLLEKKLPDILYLHECNIKTITLLQMIYKNVFLKVFL